MVDFYHRRFNLLLCTTIIESGIDVPTANTIMINHADRLGLAQLHQLRGRVGRSHHRAFAYLLVPSRAGADAGCGQAPGGHRVAGRTGRGLRAGHARPGDPRRRRIPRRSAERRADRSGPVACTWTCWRQAVRALHAGQRAGARPAAGRHHRGQPARAGAAARRLRAGRAPAPRRSTSASRAADATALDDLQAEIVDRFGPLPAPASNLLAIAAPAPARARTRHPAPGTRTAGRQCRLRGTATGSSRPP